MGQRQARLIGRVYGHTLSVFWQRFLLGAILWVLAAVSAAEPVLRYRIEGVGGEIRANMRAYLGESPQSESDARRFLQTLETRATNALEALGYYRSTLSVSLREDESPRLAVISVEPGEALTYTAVAVSLSGDGMTDPELQRFIDAQQPRIGSPLHHGTYEGFKGDLQQLARTRGYFRAAFVEQRVDVHVAEGRVELSLQLDTGPRYRFGDFVFDDTLIDGERLRRLAPFEQGEPYLQRGLLVLRQRLTRLGYFAGVTVLPDLDGAATEPGTVPVRVDLVPAPAHSFEVGAGYSTDTRQRLSLVWRSPRLNRHGHSQETSLRWSPVNPQARITYSIPLDDPANDVLQFIGRLEDNEFGDLQSNQREFKLRRELTRGRQISSLDARVLDEQWGVFDDTFSAGFALLGATYSTRNRSGSPVDPSGGLSQFYSLEAGAAELGSDEDILRAYGTLTGVKRLHDDWRLVWRAEAGLLWSSSRRPDELPPSLAFFAGGDNSIRGFAYQSVGREVAPAAVASTSSASSLVVGGTRLVTGSLEMQRYINSDWRVALFADAGDAFVDDFDASVGLGFGVHYLSPVGALRLELASPVSDEASDWRIHINIGAEF